MYCVYFGLIFCILGNGLIVHAQNGYCNHASDNCGAPCNTDDDCPGGACWADQDDCDLTGYCNAASSNCGARCIIKDDCPGGDCWAAQDSCVYAGYCNAASDNCGARCNIKDDCPGGDCWAAQDSCVYAGYCNAASDNCGARCNIKDDCPGGDCWAAQDSCVYAGYCNAASDNCGARCNINDDCPGGDCFEAQDSCVYAGYCNAASDNCGARCNIKDDCPGGDCFEDPESCGSPDHIIGTYMGAIPGGIRAPPISSITPTVNLIMLSFATDPQDDGHFQAFSEWPSQGITKENIEIDKADKPYRRYLVSLGGAVGYGGTFEIQPGISVDTWVSNSVDSVSVIIESLSADGAEMQFEGGTGDANFQPAMIGLLSGLKSKGYLTAIGPYYGGTWNDYAQLPLDNVDYVNLQLYATGTNTVDGIVNNIQSAVSDIGNDWSKMIAGFNTANRSPDPNVALMAVYELQANLKGTFSWDIEHSVSCNPAYCLENNSANILDQGQQPGSCSWPSST